MGFTANREKTKWRAREISDLASASGRRVQGISSRSAAALAERRPEKSRTVRRATFLNFLCGRRVQDRSRIFRPICVNCQSAAFFGAKGTRRFSSRGSARQRVREKRAIQPNANRPKATKRPHFLQIADRDSIYI